MARKDKVISLDEANKVLNDFFTASDKSNFDMAQFFYSFGVSVASNIKAQGLTEINHKKIEEGFSDMFVDNNNISIDDANKYLMGTSSLPTTPQAEVLI